MLELKKNKKYRIKGNSPYFLKKYGTSNPIFVADCKDTDAWPGGYQAFSCFATELFIRRCRFEWRGVKMSR
jgi:hypothetical protein